LNPFKRIKLKSKLRNCDYKLAGTVIKQQYYNENSYTEINRMIDHFMEEPGFDRALDLIEYNEMIVFYFTESCTDGLYVRKAPSSVDPTSSLELPEETRTEQAPIFATPPSIRTTDESAFQVQSSESIRNEPSTHSEHRQKIQESEEWMDQMINRLARKPKLPTVSHTTLNTVRDFSSPIVTPTAKIYDDEEAETFDTIEFKSVDAIRDIEVFEDVEAPPKIEVFYETEVTPEPEKAKKEIEVFYDPEVVQEIEVFQDPEVIQEVEVFHETEVFQAPEVIHEKDAFEFVASAASSKHLDMLDPAFLFTTPPTVRPTIEPIREKQPSFPNVAATLKIDLHTMMKQLEEYRHQLAYHPNNEQQLIRWIESLEKAVDEFSSAIDIIEDVYE
jgi:hypothetical protein